MFEKYIFPYNINSLTANECKHGNLLTMSQLDEVSAGAPHPISSVTRHNLLKLGKEKRKEIFDIYSSGVDNKKDKLTLIMPEFSKEVIEEIHNDLNKIKEEGVEDFPFYETTEDKTQYSGKQVSDENYMESNLSEKQDMKIISDNPVPVYHIDFPENSRKDKASNRTRTKFEYEDIDYDADVEDDDEVVVSRIVHTDMHSKSSSHDLPTSRVQIVSDTASLSQSHASAGQAELFDLNSEKSKITYANEKDEGSTDIYSSNLDSTEDIGRERISQVDKPHKSAYVSTFATPHKQKEELYDASHQDTLSEYTNMQAQHYLVPEELYELFNIVEENQKSAKRRLERREKDTELRKKKLQENLTMAKENANIFDIDIQDITQYVNNDYIAFKLIRQKLTELQKEQETQFERDVRESMQEDEKKNRIKRYVEQAKQMKNEEKIKIKEYEIQLELERKLRLLHKKKGTATYSSYALNTYKFIVDNELSNKQKALELYFNKTFSQITFWDKIVFGSRCSVGNEIAIHCIIKTAKRMNTHS